MCVWRARVCEDCARVCEDCASGVRVLREVVLGCASVCEGLRWSDGA